MPQCSFCRRPIEPGTGKMYVRSDGTVFYFCSSKCQRNAKIRVPKRVRWTKVTEGK